MKSSQLNEMNLVELEARLSENLDAVQNLRFQQALQQIEDSTQIRKMKREISQIKTVLREYQLGIRQPKSNN
ncbi:MAG TPA: 50S ribosomal protein L29 [Candidatus Marinimicrobia bacterium]|nr:50S ribosomal protein L29 [Candidatus Neomarinimicrobiota bacterium]